VNIAIKPRQAIRLMLCVCVCVCVCTTPGISAFARVEDFGGRSVGEDWLAGA